MPTDHAVGFTSGSPETVLEPLSPGTDSGPRGRRWPFRRPSGGPPSRRWRRKTLAACRPGPPWPNWPTPTSIATPSPGSGYHRGLDALRAAGWRGSGYVRWRHESNRGFLRSLHALEQAADAIGEVDEAQRCALFLRQLDPEWETSRAVVRTLTV